MKQNESLPARSAEEVEVVKNLVTLVELWSLLMSIRPQRNLNFGAKVYFRCKSSIGFKRCDGSESLMRQPLRIHELPFIALANK